MIIQFTVHMCLQVVKTKRLSRFSSVITGDDIMKVAVQPDTVHVSNRCSASQTQTLISFDEH